MNVKVESSYTASVEVPHPVSDDGYFWVNGSYGSSTRITCNSHVSEDDAKEKLREFARRLMAEVGA